jgi:hypothetical protein
VRKKLSRRVGSKTRKRKTPVQAPQRKGAQSKKPIRPRGKGKKATPDTNQPKRWRRMPALPKTELSHGQQEEKEKKGRNPIAHPGQPKPQKWMPALPL